MPSPEWEHEHTEGMARAAAVRISRISEQRLREGGTVPVLIEAADPQALSEAFQEESIVPEGALEILLEVFPAPVVRVRLSLAQIERVSKLPGVLSIEEDVEVFGEPGKLL